MFLFERKSRISQFKRENDKTHTYELIGEFKTCRSEYPNGINSWNDFFNGYKYTDIFKQHLKTGYKELFQNLVKALQLDIDKTVAREKLVNTVKRVRLYASDLEIRDHSIPSTSVPTGNDPIVRTINVNEATDALIDVFDEKSTEFEGKMTIRVGEYFTRVNHLV